MSHAPHTKNWKKLIIVSRNLILMILVLVRLNRYERYKKISVRHQILCTKKPFLWERLLFIFYAYKFNTLFFVSASIKMPPSAFTELIFFFAGIVIFAVLRFACQIAVPS